MSSVRVAFTGSPVCWSSAVRCICARLREDVGARHRGIGVHRPAADDRRRDAAAQLPAVERRVLRLRPQRRRAGSSPRASGASTVMSAGAPAGERCRRARRRMRAGFTDSSSTSRGERDQPAVHQAIEARATRTVSSPTMPNGARSNSTCFSSAWCGAWSVAMTSTLPSARPVEHRVAVGGLAQRRVHLQVGVVLDRRRRAPRRSATK